MAALRQRDIRRLREQAARPDGVASPVGTERGAQLRARPGLSQGDMLLPGRGWRWAAAGGMLAVVVVLVGGGAWIWLGRGGGGTGEPEPQPVRTRAKPLPPDRQVLVPAIPPTIADKAAYTVAVLNASGVSGAARGRVAPRVERAGYTVGTVTDGNRSDIRRSVVMWRPGKQAVAQNVAHDLDIRTAPPLDGVTPRQVGGADVVVVVGRDLARRG